ncbi:PaaI family thioesterase [Nocardioides albidus]|uniref:PaaI family thioesterase n=1 Tax=Nocardioides albidus TaxID=1517589 RepID=A0A5C4WL55_9ACTN|nr:PaaI family thioesterase [Nocardioides albidus]TNM48286.1 PaaI family thioesterase [Nocardioides albidus]
MTTPLPRVSDVIETMPIARLLGLTVESAAPDQTVISMPVRPDLTFDGVHCQGGVVAMLADFAAVRAAFAAVVAEGRFVATTAIEAHNLRPARGQRLVAVGRLIGRPGRTMVAAADVYCDSPDGEHCLTGLFTATALDPSAATRRAG